MLAQDKEYEIRLEVYLRGGPFGYVHFTMCTVIQERRPIFKKRRRPQMWNHFNRISNLKMITITMLISNCIPVWNS